MAENAPNVQSSAMPWNPVDKKGSLCRFCLPWTHSDKSKNARKAERKLLSWMDGVFLNLAYKDKDSNEEHSLNNSSTVASHSSGSITSQRESHIASVVDVDVDAHGNYIHTLIIEPVSKSNRNCSLNSTKSMAIPDSTVPSQSQKHNLVLTHGYFTGLGFYYRNYGALSQVDGWNIFSIDWLGMGLSSRPRFNNGFKKPDNERVSNAEEFFVESLEEWRKCVGIDKMMLCGHSFGGYMSAAYALKYPEHVEKLVLISPIGIPEAPPGVDDDIKNGRFPRRGSDVSKPDNQSSPKADPMNSNKTKEKEGRSLIQNSTVVKLLMSLWERNYTPQWLIRSIGPYSHKLIDKYVDRFTWLTEQERNDLAEYTYNIAVLPGSSEYALGDILKPGAFARKPLIDRLSKIKMPTTFMYGSHDWVDYSGGKAACAGMSVKTQVHIVPKAGHNIHLENPDGFNSILINEMKGVNNNN